MGVDGPSPWYFSLEFCASRIKTSCNCCGIQDCCTLILLTVQQGKGKEKNHNGKTPVLIVLQIGYLRMPILCPYLRVCTNTKKKK